MSSLLIARTTISCDTGGCDAEVRVDAPPRATLTATRMRDDQALALRVAEAEGWTAAHGKHHCPGHR